MTTLETISLAALDDVTGGISQSAQAKQVCNRQQYDWMAAHMVPDRGLKPGVQRHVVLHDAQMCGFPLPK
ncbi:MAG TPA: hypothetical protein VLX92_28990 [Kofleriaceae bacterium]|nr:hypothetical protein [Kofleriaceae bacterium]